jgi:signal transduction histidine kinase
LAVAVQNGIGSSVNSNGATAGVGIVDMTERATAVGERLRAGQVSDGFRVDAQLPYGRP